MKKKHQQNVAMPYFGRLGGLKEYCDAANPSSAASHFNRLDQYASSTAMGPTSTHNLLLKP